MAAAVEEEAATSDLGGMEEVSIEEVGIEEIGEIGEGQTEDTTAIEAKEEIHEMIDDTRHERPDHLHTKWSLGDFTEIAGAL